MNHSARSTTGPQAVRRFATVAVSSLVKALLTLPLLVSFLTLHSAPVHAQPSTDFDRDGLSEFTQVRIEGDGSLSWFTASVANGGVRELGSFGRLGDHLAVGHWFLPNVPTIAFKRLTDEGVRWVSIEDGVERSRFLLGDRESDLLSGGDFNGNGIGDAATVRVSGKDLIWTVASDPFLTNGGIQQEIAFGKSRDVPFFVSRDGRVDLLSVLRKRRGKFSVHYRSADGSLARKVNLNRVRSGNYDPLPLKGVDGRDLIALVAKRSRSKRIMLFNFRGKRRRVVRSSEVGTVIIGDYLPAPGEEIAIQRQDNSSFEVHNPWTGAVVQVSSSEGIPVDEINLNSFRPVAGGDGNNPGSGGNGGGGANCPLVSTPGQCRSADARDGNEGFLWKPNSDTMFYAVMLLPNTYTSCTAKVETVSPQGVIIKELTKKAGTPNGGREAFQDFSLTGRDYKRQYGSVIVRATMKNRSCLEYLVDDPSRRTD